MIEKSRIRDRKVVDSVKIEHDQGLCSRVRRRDEASNILFGLRAGARGNGFLGGWGNVGVTDPLSTKCASASCLSVFLLSRVSECRLKSYLAELKLFLFSSLSPGGGSAGIASPSSSSSAEPEDLLRIELSQRHHVVDWRRRKDNKGFEEASRRLGEGLNGLKSQREKERLTTHSTYSCNLPTCNMYLTKQL